MKHNNSFDETNLTFPLNTGRFCFITNLNNYLHHHGITFTENELACALGYWGFSFENTKEMNVCGRNNNLQTLFEVFKSLFNIEEIKPNDQNLYSLEFVQHILSQNIYPIIWLDTFYLEHSIYFKQAHHHTLCIILNVDSNLIHFFDNGLFTIKTTEFLSLLKTQSMQPTYYCRQSEQKYHKELLINNGLVKVAANFTAKSPHQGFNGMYAFLEYFKKLKDTKEIYNVYFQLNRPGGLAISREMFSEFLCELKTNHNLEIPNDLIEAYNNLTKDWRLIANLCYKLSFEYDATLHKRIIDRIEKVFLDEKLGHEKLIKIQMTASRTEF